MKTKYITFTAIMSAIIFVTTAYILHIPVGNGYVHIGDSFVYLAGCLLPKQYAIFAGIIGATLADGLTGYAIWIVPSAIIKGLTASVFTNKKEAIMCEKNIIALILSFIFCVLGYFVAELILYKNITSALLSIPHLMLQAGISAIIFIVVSKTLDKIKFKTIFFKE